MTFSQLFKSDLFRMMAIGFLIGTTGVIAAGGFHGATLVESGQ